MLNNSYRYDEYANITKITNIASPLANGMGGAFDFEFGYDTLNRLIGTRTNKVIDPKEGIPISSNNLAQSSYQLEMTYNDVGGILA